LQQVPERVVAGFTKRVWTPGVWVEHAGPLVICESGLHANFGLTLGEAFRRASRYVYPHGGVWRVEVSGEVVRDGDKLIARRMRIVEEIDRAEAFLAAWPGGDPSRLVLVDETIDMARAIVRLKQRQVGELRVRAGVGGVLQLVPVEVGQQVTPGTNLARVANPSQLQAELKIAETQAKDVQVGQVASIDTHNGIVPGRVMRIDPSVQNGTVTVDVALEGALPKGARPDLSVDGTIELERLDDVLYVGRPAFGQEQSAVQLFKVQPNSEALRVQVRLGRSSVNTVEVVSGLNVGDEVVLSDMSTWDEFDRVRLQ
jgi:hypothetical protein